MKKIFTDENPEEEIKNLALPLGIKSPKMWGAHFLFTQSTPIYFRELFPPKMVQGGGFWGWGPGTGRNFWGPRGQERVTLKNTNRNYTPTPKGSNMKDRFFYPANLFNFFI